MKNCYHVTFHMARDGRKWDVVLSFYSDSPQDLAEQIMEQEDILEDHTYATVTGKDITEVDCR